ncbi:hyoscyamine 6-dioxygenase-like [Rosa rugosa]|uniref:hyoscyamine 6-dioxygenase-like n=1 Tax=Rosa rugosa TaxID=74645 RepID=UPI002B415DAF|nr:hyoscyamine 6-dioxygenase-like [Rosa rugosa]
MDDNQLMDMLMGQGEDALHIEVDLGSKTTGRSVEETLLELTDAGYGEPDPEAPATQVVQPSVADVITIADTRKEKAPAAVSISSRSTGSDEALLPGEKKRSHKHRHRSEKHEVTYTGRDVKGSGAKRQKKDHPVPESSPSLALEVIGSYSVEARKLSLGLSELICEGLGLESGFFGDELTQVQVMALNHYPPCPNPSITLGLLKHCDSNLLTLLIHEQEVHGLQVFKDEQWFVVEPVPDAFVVNIGHTLQIISNGKLSSAEHRVVTNKKVSRMSVVSFIHPSGNCHIDPAKALLDKDCSTPLYRDLIYKDFFSTYITDIQEGLPPLQHYKLRP